MPCTRFPDPANDKERLAALRQLLILDTPPEERFDRIVEFATREFEVPTGLVSLVDENRQWFKARCGMDSAQTGRDVSFCGHAIHGHETLVVNNALEDARFHDSPLVTAAYAFVRGRRCCCPCSRPGPSGRTRVRRHE